ncbi:hypothetical protein BDC45DRAFT_118901 [Circinella umbellata]|nr:hypothetical protein BDC45DRAFT_118901 [Circinella umbellata]
MHFIIVFCFCSGGRTEEEQSLFLNLLRRLASNQLTHLNLEDDGFKFSILDLLSVCPNLTHFSYHTNTIPYRFLRCYTEPIQLLPYDQTSYNLIYLHVATTIPFIQYQVQSILHKTPNLKYFIGGYKETDTYMDAHEQKSQIIITPQFVSSLCSKLEYYIGDGSYEKEDKLIQNILRQTPTLLPGAMTTNSNNSSDNNDQQKNQLYYLSVCSYKNANSIIRILSNNKDTINYIKLVGSDLEPRNNPSAWTRAFQTISMEHLHTLCCENIDCSMDSIIALLNTCSNTIQDVQLQHSHESHILDVPTLESLQTLPQLRILTVKPVTFVNKYSVVALFKRLPLLENLIFNLKESVPLPDEAALLLKNLRHLTLEDTYVLDEHETRLVGPPLVSPIFFVSLSQSGSKIESVTLKDGKDIGIGNGVGIPFVSLHGLGSLPSLKTLDVRGLERNFNGERNEEKEEQHMLKFLNNLLHGCDNNTNSNKATVASSPTKIENLILYDLSKLTYNMLNILNYFPSLQELTVYMAIDVDWDNIESPVRSDSMCLNVDLYGVLELLRRCKTLKRVSFRWPKSCGERLTSAYLHDKLAEQQENDIQLRKYYVFNGEFSQAGENDIRLENSVVIINTKMFNIKF